MALMALGSDYCMNYSYSCPYYLLVYSIASKTHSAWLAKPNPLFSGIHPVQQHPSRSVIQMGQGGLDGVDAVDQAG